jgi:hypothetical protein|tara:strand:- start:2146 stop:2676 length:531 start_codon:yes stop_codon:yes gene_type:complete
MKNKIELGIIGFLTGLSLWLFLNPTIQEVEKIKEIEVLQTVIDSIYVEKLVEKKVYVPKYITETKTDTITIEVIKEIEKPVEVVKTVYVDKPYEVIVPKYELPESKWYAGFAYQYDLENYFSGANVQILHKFKSDKMFSLDVGFRNDLLDKETGVGKLRPYVGGTIYFRLDNPNKL